MAKIKLLMAFHCHQPVDNFDHVFHRAYEKSYLPFIDVLKRHPKVKVALHYSGCLLDWCMKNKPEFIKLLKALVKSGQAEMMTGGYYEPILSIIPDRDKRGQIRLMSDYLEKTFGSKPRGLWLTERVWEPYLAKVLHEAGVEYTIADDSHFFLSGMQEDQTYGYYVTESEGKPVKIFPSLKTLRYSMPFKAPEETIGFLKSAAREGEERLFVFGDDGEKFGLWPHTYTWVYERGWLENFFSALEANSDWINMCTFSEALDTVEPKGRVYLPCASYSEMMEWSSGYFNTMFTKYPEANSMHKRMLMVSEKIARLQGGPAAEEALHELYKSQCNCGYWHGVFGGFYLYHLRASIYHHLLMAEGIADEAKAGKAQAEYAVLDYDDDGHEEVIVATDRLSYIISPRQGGGMIELDDRKKCVNILNVMSRRPEPHHEKLKDVEAQVLVRDGDDDDGQPQSIHDIIKVKERGLEQLLAYDDLRRMSLADHILETGLTAERFSNNDYVERADFVAEAYAHKEDKERGGVSVTLSRTSATLGTKLKVEKTVTAYAGKATLHVRYEIKNVGKKKAVCRFGSEYNLSVRPPDAEAVKALSDQKKYTFQDEWNDMALTFAFEDKVDIWQCPIFTISDSEGGMEKNYQGMCLVVSACLSLQPGDTYKTGWAMAVGT